MRTNKKRNTERAGSEAVSNGQVEENGEGSKGNLPVIGQPTTLVTNDHMPRTIQKNMHGTSRSLSVVPSGMKGGPSRKAIREGIDMLEAKFL